MAYENDIIMRQVRDMTRMLAKILFGKNTATYEYKEEDRHTATDSLYARLIARSMQEKSMKRKIACMKN